MTKPDWGAKKKRSERRRTKLQSSEREDEIRAANEIHSGHGVVLKAEKGENDGHVRSA